MFVLFLYLITWSPAPFSSHHATHHTLGSMCSSAQTQIHTMGSMIILVLLLRLLIPLVASPLMEQGDCRSQTYLLLLETYPKYSEQESCAVSLKVRQTAIVWLSCVQNMGRKELRITKQGPLIVSALLYPLCICIKMREWVGYRQLCAWDLDFCNQFC